MLRETSMILDRHQHWAGVAPWRWCQYIDPLNAFYNQPIRCSMLIVEHFKSHIFVNSSFTASIINTAPINFSNLFPAVKNLFRTIGRENKIATTMNHNALTAHIQTP